MLRRYRRLERSIVRSPDKNGEHGHSAYPTEHNGVCVFAACQAGDHRRHHHCNEESEQNDSHGDPNSPGGLKSSPGVVEKRSHTRARVPLTRKNRPRFNCEWLLRAVGEEATKSLGERNRLPEKYFRIYRLTSPEHHAFTLYISRSSSSDDMVDLFVGLSSSICLEFPANSGNDISERLPDITL